MIEVMPEAELQRWLKNCPADFRYAPVIAELGVDKDDFHKWMRGQRKIAKRHMVPLTRIVRAYQAGMLEFKRLTKSNKLSMVRRETARHMPATLKITLGGPFPTLQVIGRPSAPDVIRKYLYAPAPLNPRAPVDTQKK